jgi:hypothetical protein
MIPRALLMMAAALGCPADGSKQPTPEDRALAYLVREVPSWPAENRCFSCHNNGDGMRALCAAMQRGIRVPPRALKETTKWLARPGDWDHNGGNDRKDDHKLATIQFAATLIAAQDAGLLKERRPLLDAAERVARLQDRDGCWRVVARGSLGSPTTLGDALATHFARQTLRRADARKYAEPLKKADAWLRNTKIETVLDAASVLLALGKDADAAAQRRRCLEVIRKGESKGGGWGPYVRSSPEVFDTALVLLALAGQENTAEIRGLRRRGRAYLLSAQEKDGSWPETTRPSGNISYAQHVSTTAWATLALLATLP